MEFIRNGMSAIKKKKIVFLHPAHWKQAMGGAELQISYLVKYMKKQGFEVHFIYEDNGIHIKNDDTILHPLKKIKIRKTFGERLFLRTKIIKKILKKIQPDIIYTRSCSSWSGIAATYSKENNIIHIWAIASDKDVCKKGVLSLLRRPLDLIEMSMINKAFRHAGIIISQNKFQQKELAIHYNRKSVIIPQMAPLVEETMIKKNAVPLEIVWIANIKPLKRPELFIQLVKKFKKNKACRFRMIGLMDNNYLKLVQAASYSLENFAYLGVLSNDKVNDILCKSHFLINTSDYEGFSNTFVQAWMRKVIVLSMHSNPDSILTDYRIGFVCPTLKKMTEKLDILINDKFLRDQMSERAYKFAIQNHSLEKNISKVLNLMNPDTL